ncbi:MAG: TadE/TadG family type IV pilus assembly protein [Thermoproteota archaeon]
MKKHVRGLETLELLLVLPIFVSILVMVVNSGYAVFANQLVQEAARAGCRVGVVSVNPEQAARQVMEDYLQNLVPSEKAFNVEVGNGFLLCTASYRVPSVFPLFPTVWVHGKARFRMEGWR